MYEGYPLYIVNHQGPVTLLRSLLSLINIRLIISFLVAPLHIRDTKSEYEVQGEQRVRYQTRYRTQKGVHLFGLSVVGNSLRFT